MDLRDRIREPRVVERAKQLVIDGLLNYQPWIFSDALETGVGYEWAKQEHIGLVYFPDIDPELAKSPGLRRLVIEPARYAEFHEANAQLRRFYDGMIDGICARLGDISRLSFLDVGCNTGYLPQSFALRGARAAAGCDREKGFARTFGLLNEILGTRAKFYDAHFDPRTHAIRGSPGHDVVLSMAVLCHQSDPLGHLAALGSLSRKALFVWTLVNRDDGCTIRLGEPRGDYREDAFPHCFDRDTTLSDGLMRKSLELMGYARVDEIPARDSGLPRYSWRGVDFRGYLAVR